ncbi:dTDP-4-dehydrorhamnose 3,5-epimerase family protein [Streptomyces sp. NPDC047072]|uniref:dTDP-4-dehydrorhamnose 3,5-epimerase family protein n=1 Tax=Streptomyces sp. NPDC047072 TaxID=3154809 RepID=UPI0033C8E347
MDARELSIPGAWLFAAPVLSGERGEHVEPYSAPEFTAVVGRPLSLGHLNVTVARAGSVFGVHYGDVPPGQAKYLHCVSGAVWDVVVDLRVGSPTFGRWEGVVLDDVDRHAVYLGEGLGHAYVSLADRSTLVYVCSQPFMPDREHSLNPMDPALGIAWPRSGRDGTPLTLTLGRRDGSAPTLEEARAAGRLPVLTEEARG